MKILSNYLEYRKNKPKYSEWRQQREEKLAKKEQYLKDNPISKEEKTRYIEKANVILNAVDTMDEFSQSKAENTEIATDAITGLALSLSMTAGMGLGLLFMKSKGGQTKLNKLVQKHPNLEGVSAMLPSIAGSFASLPLVAPIVTWATKNQIFASKIGRHEAITTQLNSEKQFAILDEQQMQELNKKAENIEIQEENKKNNAPQTFKEAKATINNIIHENQEVQEYIKAQNEQFEAEKQNFDKPLSDEEIKKAKEEQQMITQIVEEIDKASQDYAEDVEFGTNTLIASGGIIGAAAGFVIKGIAHLVTKLKGKNLKETAQKTIEQTAQQTSKAGKIFKFMPAIAGFIGLVAASAVATKLQKQASRVARFKVMQDFQNNPEKLAYVEEDKLKDIEISNTDKKEEKKENLFSFYLRLFKENREYNKYKKENNIKDKKLRLAKNDIELTEKQKSDAKQLQQNIFKTFNKIDDKSQTYSESTEALGEIIKEYGSTALALGGTMLSMALVTKNINKKSSAIETIKNFAPIFLSLIPIILLDSYVTKEQKQSSRVAHMLAINELEDYRHFANYSNENSLVSDKKEAVKPNEKQNKTEQKETGSKEEIKSTSSDKPAEISKQESKVKKPVEQKPEQKEADAKTPGFTSNTAFLQNLNLDKAFSKFM